jgi:hypothetical protein
MTGDVRSRLRRHRDVRTRATETGLDCLELAEDDLELLRDMSMRIGMMAGHALELDLPPVDLNGDRTSLVHGPAWGVSGRRDFDPLGHAVGPDLESEGADLRRRSRRSVGHRRRRRAMAPLHPRAGAARRLEASGVRSTIVERPTSRATPFKSGAVWPATRSAGLRSGRPALMATALVISRALGLVPAVMVFRLLEKRHERPDGFVGTAIGAGRGRAIANGESRRQADEHDRRRQQRQAERTAGTERKLHGDYSPGNWNHR